MGASWSSPSLSAPTKKKKTVNKPVHKCKFWGKAHISQVIHYWERHFFKPNSKIFIPSPLIQIIENYASSRIDAMKNENSMHPKTPFYDGIHRILLLGDSGVGRTSLLIRYSDDTFSDYRYDGIGLDFRIKTIETNDLMLNLQIRNTAGQERFPTIITSYYRGVHVFFCVYEITGDPSLPFPYRYLSPGTRQPKKHRQRIFGGFIELD